MSRSAEVEQEGSAGLSAYNRRPTPLTVLQPPLGSRELCDQLIRVGVSRELVLGHARFLSLSMKSASHGEMTFREEHAGVGELDRALGELDGLVRGREGGEDQRLAEREGQRREGQLTPAFPVSKK